MISVSELLLCLLIVFLETNRCIVIDKIYAPLFFFLLGEACRKSLLKTLYGFIRLAVNRFCHV